MFGVFTEAALVGATAGATTKFGEAAVDKLLATEWKGSIQQRWKIENAVKSKVVLGTRGTMRLQQYANSPILNYLRKYVVGGVVLVAFVPSGMGKTTACQAFLDKFVQKNGGNRGLAISPDETSEDSNAAFFDHMIHLLLPDFDINSSRLPVGLLGMILDTLDNRKYDRTPSVLLLDDFMVSGPNEHDIKLLLQLKRHVRQRNIAVVVLTSNRESANYMLTMNNMQGIRPLVSHREVVGIHREFRAGGFSRGDRKYSFDWGKYMDLKWPDDELKTAMNENQDTSRITDLDRKIDAILSNLPADDRKELTPVGLRTMLVMDDMQLAPITTNPSEDGGNPCGLPDCTNCTVM